MLPGVRPFLFGPKRVRSYFFLPLLITPDSQSLPYSASPSRGFSSASLCSPSAGESPFGCGRTRSKLIGYGHNRADYGFIAGGMVPRFIPFLRKRLLKEEEKKKVRKAEARR